MKIHKAENGYTLYQDLDDYVTKTYVFLTWSELISWLEKNPVEA